MGKIIDKLWKRLSTLALRQTAQELADFEMLTALAPTMNERIINRARQHQTEDIDLGEKFKMLFETNLVAMSFYDKDGNLIDLNTQMRKLCGFDTLGEDYFRKTRLFDSPAFSELDPESRDVFHCCQHMYYPDIDIDHYIEVNVMPTFDDHNCIFYYIVTVRDITDERAMYIQLQQKEKELRQVGKHIEKYEQQLQYLLKNNNMYVWFVDIENRKIIFTRSLSKQEFTETFDEYIESIYEDEREQAATRFAALLQHGTPISTLHHFRYTPAEHQPQWYMLDGGPTLDKYGRTTSIFGLARNVTKLMTIQQQLRTESNRAEASGLMKSAFLANMTHEIRTPLNAIVGFSDLLQIVDDPSERQEFIRIILGNCDMLLRLINDILEASDMGQALAIEPTDIDFAQAFDDICQTLEQRVQEPGVEFIKDNPFNTFPTRLDRGRIQQVITNFVTNAVKYTHQGHIKVGYRAEESDDGQQHTLYVYCEDTGAGIPKDKQASVFERFVKLNDHVQGTGLGLSICKNIIERCGGQIGVTSQGEGHGSTFWFQIPCTKTNQQLQNNDAAK